jgi:hypothetical protein
MKISALPVCLFLILLISFCKSDREPETASSVSAVFDPTGSDPEAIWVAEDAIAASGGAEAWANTPIIKWNFFGRRWLLWDKANGKVRIENVANDTRMILDLHTKNGKLFKDGKEWTDPDTLKKYMEIAFRTWTNDSYWLAMPFKMKDPGVSLHYLREDTTLSGIGCDVISLTFDSVGVTPNNKYEVWVGKNSSLVAQWAYYPNATDSVPSILCPWDGYVKYGDIFLSGDRGEKRQLTGIKVYETLPASLFENFEPVDFSTL